MTDSIQRTAVVAPAHSDKRLDQVAASLFSEFSRAQLQQWMKDGYLTVDGQPCKPRDKVFPGAVLVLDVVLPRSDHWQPQALALEIVYEDDDLFVINKPAGLVVHPGAGSPDGTLLNALLHRDPALAQLPRAGIVHRLDKDTSGLLVVARTLQAQTDLVRQLQARTVHREYEAVACGVLTSGGTVDAPIGRHPRERTRMAVVSSGKPAVTHYRVLHRFAAHTHIRVKLETGRTHQIRVHMAHIHHPLFGDPVYGGRLKLPAGLSPDLREILQGFQRQALHAVSLGLHHPGSGEWMQWKSPLPEDFRQLLAALAEHDDSY